MKISQLKLLLVVLIALIFLSGCITYQAPLRDPSYVPPVPPQPVQVTPQQQAYTGSIYNSQTSRFLFENYRARRVGDILTVLLEESTAASKSASTSTKKGSGVAMSVPNLFGRVPSINGRRVLDAEASGSVNFNGQGDSAQSNSLSGNLTVHVAQVLPNGYLRVRGEKLLTLNQGSEVVRISGIVRPEDISPNNSIYSHQIAAAEIAYKGKGLVSDSNEAGWLTRFFHKPAWPL